MIQAVLFDLDGTLLDSEPDFTSALNILLAARERPPVSREAVRETVSDGAAALLRLITDEAPDSPLFAQLRAEFLDIYEQQLARPASFPFPGMSTMLESLEEQGLYWGIVTNKPCRFTHVLQKQLPLLARSRVTVCADQVARGKPAPDSLLLASRQLGCPAAATLYVGDHPRDIQAGRAAGMPTAAATWGYLPPSPPPTEWGADIILNSPQELLLSLQPTTDKPA